MIDRGELYEGDSDAEFGVLQRENRHNLYRMQLIEKDRYGTPVVTEKGKVYISKLRDAVRGITLTPRPSRVEWV